MGCLLENMASDKVWSGVEKGVGSGIIRCDGPKWKNCLIKGDIAGNDDFVSGKVKATKSTVVEWVAKENTWSRAWAKFMYPGDGPSGLDEHYLLHGLEKGVNGPVGVILVLFGLRVVVMDETTPVTPFAHPSSTKVSTNIPGSWSMRFTGSGRQESGFCEVVLSPNNIVGASGVVKEDCVSNGTSGAIGGLGFKRDFRRGSQKL
ncbi:hypothetical protein Tco_0965794 [Tanacetum coccineum]